MNLCVCVYVIGKRVKGEKGVYFHTTRAIPVFSVSHPPTHVTHCCHTQRSHTVIPL